MEICQLIYFPKLFVFVVSLTLLFINDKIINYSNRDANNMITIESAPKVINQKVPQQPNGSVSLFFYFAGSNVDS